MRRTFCLLALCLLVFLFCFLMESCKSLPLSLLGSPVQIVDLKKKDIFQGLLQVNWAQIRNQPMLTEASHICFISEKSHRLSYHPPALCSCHLNQPFFIKEFLSILTNGLRPELCNQNYPLCPHLHLRDQSEKLRNGQSECDSNQLGQCYLDQSDCAHLDPFA